MMAPMTPDVPILSLRRLVVDAVGDRSLREVDRASGGRLNRDTLSRVTRGTQARVSEATLQALHDVLRIPLADLRRANGQDSTAPDQPFVPPDRLNALITRERQLLVEVGDALLAARRRET